MRKLKLLDVTRERGWRRSKPKMRWCTNDSSKRSCVNIDEWRSNDDGRRLRERTARNSYRNSSIGGAVVALFVMYEGE